MSGQVFGAGVYLDARYDPRLGQHPHKRGAVAFRLPDGLVVEDRPADEVPQGGRGYDQFPPGPAGFDRLRDAQLGKPLVAGGVALVHGQQTLARGYHRPDRGVKFRFVHLATPASAKAFSERPFAAGNALKGELLYVSRIRPGIIPKAKRL